MAAEIVLRVEIREKRFASATGPLFEGLFFEVARGEVVALFGPSGVGKTTLLRLIAGIDDDLSGRVEVLGRPAREAGPPGYVFQDPRLLPWLDAVGNIRAVRPEMTRAAACALLSQMGLGGSEHSLPGQLSGGMQRRVALARALAVAPQLLLLDEPFVSLDRALARDLQDVVARLIARHRPTMILVSHDPEDAARLADRVIRLEGRPARIVRDMAIRAPRAARNRTEVGRIAAAIEQPFDWDKG